MLLVCAYDPDFIKSTRVGLHRLLMQYTKSLTIILVFKYPKKTDPAYWHVANKSLEVHVASNIIELAQNNVEDSLTEIRVDHTWTSSINAMTKLLQMSNFHEYCSKLPYVSFITMIGNKIRCSCFLIKSFSTSQKPLNCSSLCAL